MEQHNPPAHYEHSQPQQPPQEPGRGGPSDPEQHQGSIETNPEGRSDLGDIEQPADQDRNKRQRQEKPQAEIRAQLMETDGAVFSQQTQRRIQSQRQGQQAGLLTPKNIPPIHSEDRDQLLLHLELETIHCIVQNETHMIPDNLSNDSNSQPDNRTITWSGILKKDPNAVGALPKKTVECPAHVLIIIMMKDSHHLAKVTENIMDVMGPTLDRLDILVIGEEDKRLINLAIDIERSLTYKPDRIHKVARTIRTLGPQTWQVTAAMSTRQGRLNKLAPAYHMLRMLPPGRMASKRDVMIPQAGNMNAIQIQKRWVANIMAYLELTGEQCSTIPGKARRETRVIFQELDNAQKEHLMDQYSCTEHFSIMTVAEYEGTAMTGAELVVEMFARREVRDREGPEIWNTVKSTCKAHGVEASLQVTGRNRLRVGISGQHNMNRFYQHVVVELSARGIASKDERTGEFLQDGPDSADDTTSSASTTDSEMAKQEAAVLIDAPAWLTATRILDLIAQISESKPESIKRLQWTPGDPTKGAWRVQGEGAQALTGMLLRDPNGGPHMYFLTPREYATDKKAQQTQRERQRHEGAEPRPDNFFQAERPRTGKRGGRPSNAGRLHNQ